MKVFGTIKQSFPVNAFTPVILIDETGMYFTQIEKGGRIQGFEPIELSENEILNTNVYLRPKKGNHTIYCYTQECNTLFIGTLYSLKEQLYELLSTDKINAVAKTIITSKYRIHNKTADYVRQSNKQFQADKLNCKLSFKKYIKVTEYDDKDLKSFYDTFSSIRALIATKNNIGWEDFINITETKFYVNDYKIEIDLLFEKTNSGDDRNEIRKRLFKILTQRIEDKNLSKNVLIKNKVFFPYILSSPKRIDILDKVSFTNDVPKEFKYKSELHFEKKYNENAKIADAVDNIDFEKIYQIADKVKKAFQDSEEKINLS